MHECHIWNDGVYHAILQEFLNTLKRTGFQLNPYNPCVANSIVNNKQQAICFHVEYFKLTHKDSKVNGEFINTLRD